MVCILCNERGSKGSEISFHKFPKEANRRVQWLQACRMPATISAHAKLCSKHFTIDDFQVDRIHGRRTLKLNAIPNKYLIRIIKPHKLFYHGRADTSYPLQQVSRNSLRVVQCASSTEASQENTHHLEKEYVNIDSKCADETKITIDVYNIDINESCPKSEITTYVDKDDLISHEYAISNCPFTAESATANMQNSKKGTVSCESKSFREIQTITDIHSLNVNTSPEVITKHSSTVGVKRCSFDEPHLTTKEIPTKRKIWRLRYIGDIQLDDLGTPRPEKHHWEAAVSKIKAQQNEIKVLKQRNKRLELRLKSMKDLLSHLKKKNLSAKAKKTIIVL